MALKRSSLLAFLALILGSTVNADPLGSSTSISTNSLFQCKINGELVLQKNPCEGNLVSSNVVNRKSGTLGNDESRPLITPHDNNSNSSNLGKCISSGQNSGFTNKCKDQKIIHAKSKGYDEAGRVDDYSSLLYLSSPNGRVHVSGYTRSDGTYVRPHTRSR
ncbi:hypothetical protein [Acinetobacter guerrae]|uniref:hypothetical protein n=1 Tax=Acinetobacter guerrae TaxID=1843371 RepID=UPI00128D3489|nr:hypothetical protein [Acinetobacter guerrae]MPW43377.1 hypothetical protein [Acinetobacter guerrae]